MKGAGFLLGASFGGVARVIIKIIKIAVRAIGNAIFYFGLYVPLLFLAFGAVLFGIFRFNPFDLSVDSQLYLFGFALSCVCAVILAVKNLIIHPYYKFIKKTEVVEYKDKKLSKNAPEAPRIYKSRVNPGIIVYEYSNRYDLYEPVDGGLKPVGTEYKDRKEKRW